jgi:uncharacterized protein (DUF2141 family)
MKSIVKAGILFLVFLSGPRPACGQYRLVIEVGPLKNDLGQVILALMDANENMIEQVRAGIEGGECVFSFENLSRGKYAFKFIHDENSNNKLDTRLFIVPREGYGFSVKSKGRFGPPAFEDTVFEVVRNDTIHCEPVY